MRRLQHKKSTVTSVTSLYSTRYEVSSLVGLTYVPRAIHRITFAKRRCSYTSTVAELEKEGGRSRRPGKYQEGTHMLCAIYVQFSSPTMCCLIRILSLTTRTRNCPALYSRIVAGRSWALRASPTSVSKSCRNKMYLYSSTGQFWCVN